MADEEPLATGLGDLKIETLVPGETAVEPFEQTGGIRRAFDLGPHVGQFLAQAQINSLQQLVSHNGVNRHAE